MKRKGLLLDRDGVINADHGYIGDWGRFSFLPGLFPFLRKAAGQGYVSAVVTNQSGVARSYYSLEDYEALTRKMREALRAEGIELALVLACFTHPEGDVPGLARESFWRKPNPGMILEAGLLLDLDLSRSVLIGDKVTDVQAGLAAGVGRNVLLGHEETDLPGVKAVKDFAALESFLCHG